MKIVLLSMLCFFSTGAASQIKKDSALISLINAERKFAELASETTSKDAFLANVNESSISFNDGLGNAKEFWEKVAATEELLIWQPHYADVSLDGDLGYTTGPWNYYTTKKDNTPQGYGQYMTLWRKDGRGQWKIAVDIGITHGAIQVDSVVVQTSEIPTAHSKVINDRKSIMDLERKFIATIEGRFKKADKAYYSKEVRFLRNGFLPAIGLSAANEITSQDHLLRYEVIGVDLSSSGDLGYAYGSVKSAGNETKEEKEGFYVRVWKKENGSDWRIVVDIVSL